MTMMIMWASMMIMLACIMTMMIMYDDYDRYEAYDGHLEGCVDPAVDRGWTGRAQDGILPARPAVDRSVVIIPVSKAPPLYDTIMTLYSCLVAVSRTLCLIARNPLHLSVGRNWSLKT